MHDSGGFGSGKSLPWTFCIVSWCIIEMEIDTLNRPRTLAVAEIPFSVRQNRYTKELRVVPHLGRQSKKTVDTGRQPNTRNLAF
jgi:hypothetical protein